MLRAAAARVGSRLLLIAGATGLCAWTPCHEQPLDRDAVDSSPENLSPIRFESVFGSFQFCWRADWEPVPLRGSALYEWDLVRGTSCIVADFDGNGYLDFALQGGGLPKIRPARQLRIVFYERREPVRYLDIPGAGFELYPARPEEGEFGEPASTLDGLVKWGEGGSTFIWLFDADTGTFARSEHASENH